jgi:hypothetical protein
MEERMISKAGALNQADIFSPTSPQRLLVIGGILLIIAGMIFGDIFAVFILHPNNGYIGQAMYGAAAAVAAQDPDTVMTQFKTIGGLLENRGTKVDTHVHIIKMGYLALLLALIQPYVALSRQRRMQMAQLFLTGAVILPPSIFLIHYVGLAYSPLSTIGWASIFADLGGLLVIIACVGEFIGLCCYLRNKQNQEDSNADHYINDKSWESRTLLAGGSLMLLCGFLFGAWYAAADLKEHETREVAILHQVIDLAAANDMTAVEHTLGNYGMLQGERAVSIAAHAHINEFGLLALLLAFVQPYVFLSQPWRRRWVIVMLTGSVILPVSVYLELQFGLLAGGIADIGGLMVIVALFGMFCGVLRYTGKLDTDTGETT